MRSRSDLDALRDQLHASEKELAVKVTAAREAERALSDKESELAKLTSALDERSALASAGQSRRSRANFRATGCRAGVTRCSTPPEPINCAGGVKR
jgi:hypothetical protein